MNNVVGVILTISIIAYLGFAIWLGLHPDRFGKEYVPVNAFTLKGNQCKKLK